jgi:hypothetical protein
MLLLRGEYDRYGVFNVHGTFDFICLSTAADFHSYRLTSLGTDNWFGAALL